MSSSHRKKNILSPPAALTDLTTLTPLAWQDNSALYCLTASKQQEQSLGCGLVTIWDKGHSWTF